METTHDTEAGPRRLASALIDTGALTPAWVPVYDAVPRHLFVPDVIWPGRAGMNRPSRRVIRSEEPEVWWEAVHRDVPLTTQWDDGTHTGQGKGRVPSCSNSMPTMVFTMLAALEPLDGHRVLEIGTGTGWNAALLSARLGSGNVVTVEVDEEIAVEARRRLHAAGHTPTTVVGDGAEGYTTEAPYDRVIATCSVGRVPPAWLCQSRPGGVIVAPWGPTYGGEAVVRLTVPGDGSASGHFVGSSAFMRLRDQRRNLPPPDAFPGSPEEGERSTTALSPEDVGDWLHMFVIGVRVPDLFCRVEWTGAGTYRLWLYDTGATSRAVIGYEGPAPAYPVVQYGPRRLWDELESAWRWWDARGRPGFDRFGLTVSADGSHTVWLDDPGHRVSPTRG
ncbi:methyltransferase domain-containing protein [Streptomyces calidiresistens]|uniref:methyltransferase domain-containing protein n=1 Tax=Streptomyces calidiresistens TaxID=1485586 RepID=UPI0015FDB1A4|nr:methyltransferase domain-containing protein [Streptomyces calidiresistens]